MNTNACFFGNIIENALNFKFESKKYFSELRKLFELSDLVTNLIM